MLTRARIARGARSTWRATGLWAIADQSLVSAGNFVVAVAVARAVPPSELGAFGVLLGVIMASGAVHASVVGLPLLVLAGRRQAEQQDAMSAALALTGLSLAVYAPAMVAAALLVNRPGLLLPALFALAAVHLQDTLRRALMGRLQFRRAIWGDAVSYLGQAGVVVALAGAGRVSVAGAFLAMGGSSLAGAVVQWRQLRPRMRKIGFAGPTLTGFWRLGKALAFVNGIGAVTLYSLPWLLGALRDVRAVGSLQALLTVVALANPLMMAVNSLVTAKVAHVHGEDDLSRRSLQLAIARRYGFALGAPVAVFAVFLLAAPEQALRVFFGTDSPYGALTGELRLLVGFTVALYAYFVLAGVLAARADIRSMLRAQLAAAAALALAGIPLILVAGLAGALLAALLSSLARTLVAAAGLLRRSGSTAGVTV
jgi:O-antigen/teichoic acid export membrane protein